MATKRQNIVDAIEAKLKTVSGAGGRVTAWRKRPLRPDELPAITFIDGEATADIGVIGTRTHRLAMQVLCFTASTISASACRALCGDICAALFTDRQLGGLAVDVELDSHAINIEQADDLLAAVKIDITVIYETSLTGI